jgi:hypothetical protein
MTAARLDGTATVTVARARTGLLAHFPDVVRLPDGRLLAAYREGAGHVSHEGRICAVDSADGGRTWSAPRVAVDGPCDDRDPKLAVLADGTVLLSHFVIDWTTRPRHTVLGTYVRRSTDGGRTWSPPAEVGSAIHGAGGRTSGGYVLGWAASHGAAVQLPGGDVLLPLYGTLQSGVWQRATAGRSTDGGRTWPAAGEVLIGELDGLSLQEPTLTVLAGGEVVALIRSTVGLALLSRSPDGGRSWNPPVPTDLPASSHHALALHDGGVLVTYGDVSHRFSPRRATVGRLVRRPEQDWDGYPDMLLYDSGYDDQANPSSVEVSPGRFLTLSFDCTAGTVVGVFTDRCAYPG